MVSETCGDSEEGTGHGQWGEPSWGGEQGASGTSPCVGGHFAPWRLGAVVSGGRGGRAGLSGPVRPGVDSGQMGASSSLRVDLWKPPQSRAVI